MRNATSFIGEHSIELAIVPILKKLLHKRYEFVTPIFPWMTREGSNISMYLHKNDQFQILGVYPRRPKVVSENEDFYFKINAQVVAGAFSGMNLGIPIIAGCPLVKNFWELGKKPDFVWIKLDFDITDDLQIQIRQEEPFEPALSKIILSAKHEILNYVIDNARFFTIDKALTAFREINMKSMNSDYYPRFGFGSIYKPIYFLLK